jgi:hypothetical protein
MWRPLEIFLYDWWPIRNERRLYDGLSRAAVQIVCTDPGARPDVARDRTAEKSAVAASRAEKICLEPAQADVFSLGGAPGRKP